jgi:dTDP-4-amino-4,6-dideoxygalactose transaminase
MQENRIYLSPPHMGGNERKYVEEAFRTNWIAPLGPNVDAFEKELAGYCRSGYAAALSSGTAAIHLSLILLGVKPGDEVIASTFTFSATINPVRYLGATPVLIDSEPSTWNMSPELLEKAIKDRIRKGRTPKAIIPVHLYGMPARMDEIMAVADAYGIPVVEDAAEALGSRYNGFSAGTIGEMGILSFNGNKIITTSGGGALISDNGELIARARFLATQARDEALHYQHSEIGYNYRMSNVLAGFGRGQLEVIDNRVSRKRGIYQTYRDYLQDLDGIRFLEEPGPGYFSNRWLSCIVLDPAITGVSRLDLQATLEKHNIESRPLWKPMHLQPAFRDYPSYLNGVSEALFEKGLCLPSGTALSLEDQQRIIGLVRSSIRSHKAPVFL